MRKIKLFLVIMMLPLFTVAQQEVKRDTFYFDYDSYELSDKAKKHLQIKSGWMELEVTRIVVTGHTDADGADDYNMRLAKMRASAVLDYLRTVINKEIKYEAHAKGESAPIADNNTDVGKAKNRRVVVEYYYTPTPIEKDEAKHEVQDRPQYIVGRVYDEETGDLLKPFVAIQKEGKMITSFDDEPSFKFPANNGEEYELHISMDGYQSKIITLKVEHSTRTIRTELKPLRYSKKLMFENINFVGNQAIFLDESYDELNQLLQTMRDNPEVKIEIHGHVNGPFTNGTPMPEHISPTYNPWYYELSLARAKAVFDYLVQHGVAPNRMTYKGLGNSKMLYPYATSQKHQKLNRRVEVYILEE